jgi:pimeloyl-ACP methyl ester carboxylesterase
MLLLLSAVSACQNLPAADKAVSAIAGVTIAVHSGDRISRLPVYITLNGKPVDLARPQPAVTRALLVFHGKQRNAETYNRSGLDAIRKAQGAADGTLLITPQFLEQVDIDAYHLPEDVLRWAPEAWMGGANALNAPASTFDAVDAVLELLANRTIFPNLHTVVLAGHSAGGQLVQRYAVVGVAAESLAQREIHVRFVVANPSSYLYFSPERPRVKDGEFAFAPPADTCSDRYNRWKYGLLDTPPYVAASSIGQIEQQYVARDVIYLLGTVDTDPNHPELDKSCSGELEGPFRFFRGKAYFRYLQLRHPELTTALSPQRLWLVPGVDHDGARMLESGCGLSALFDAGGCETILIHPRP